RDLQAGRPPGPRLRAENRDESRASAYRGGPRQPGRNPNVTCSRKSNMGSMPNTLTRRTAMAAIAGASGAFAWQGQKPYPVPPDVSNARYGPHERNVFDLWRAKT